MEYVLLFTTLSICIFEKNKYKTLLTPFSVLFFPTCFLILIHKFFQFTQLNEIVLDSVNLILVTEIIFFIVSLFMKDKKYILKKETILKNKYIKIINILTLLMIIIRFFYDLQILGGLQNFEMLKLDRKNTIFSNFVEYFSVFIPVSLVSNKKSSRVVYFLYLLVQLLFQSKNRVFIVILQGLFIIDLFYNVKLKKIIKSVISIILLFFIIYNLKGFSQKGIQLNIINHNIEILKHVYYYLISPLINIENFHKTSEIYGNWKYFIIPIVEILDKARIISRDSLGVFNFFEIGNGKTSNVGSIFGEMLYVNSTLLYGAFFILLSLFSYYIYNRRNKNQYYAILSSFLLAALALSFFSNIFSLIFVWKRIFVVVVILLYRKMKKILARR
ncbi:O-antigen polymerase [Fusobacterium necrophorum]|nr:O-antigen polymerase [Fusobacterium necrophorum]MCF0163506.1 oligosaccharide repeat unit polymerase [Fusobacterium necrophorum]